ncbi:MAG: VWA domain-containing protein [Spirochaetales bacterium]|nr:VWA domain-containing protein [Spirochaetales bacterium]
MKRKKKENPAVFENPFFLLLLPLSLAVFWFSEIRRGRGGVPDSASGVFVPEAGSQGRINRTLHSAEIPDRIMHKAVNLIFMVSIILIAFSLSGPQALRKIDRYLAKGDDYFILLDISPSMAVKENGKTRLEIAKEAALEIAEASGNDYPGLVFFGSDAAIVLLPTPDKESFRERLESAGVMELGEATALGKALGTALYYLRNSESEGKRIIILSDGGSNYGELPPLDAALMASELGIPVSCIATGSAAGSLDVIVEPGPVRSAVRGKISESYNPAVLEQISEYTGGYFLENPGRLDLGILAAGLKGPEVKMETITEKTDFSNWFLITGAVMLLLSLVIKIYFLRELLP